MGARFAVVILAALLGSPDESTPNAGHLGVRVLTPSEWVLQGGEWNGDSFASEGHLTLDENGSGSLKVAGFGNFEVCAHRIDPGLSQGRINLTLKPSPLGTSWESLGIWRIKGEYLTLCIGDHRKQRPTEFHTKPDGACLLLHFKKK
jgi:hypothetical protein